MGDIVMSTPILKCLKTTYPQVKIAWLVQEEFADLLYNHELLDNLIIIPKQKWKIWFKQRKFKILIKDFYRVYKEIRRFKPDWALDLQGLLKSGIFTWVSGAKKRVGLYSKEGSQWLMTEVVRNKRRDSSRISSEYLELANYLKLNVGNFDICLPKNLKDDAYQYLIKKYQLANRSYIVFCPYTTRLQKHWLNNYWQTLATLKPFQNLNIIILGGVNDINSSHKLMENMPGNVINYVGKTKIQDSIVIIRNSRGLIGVDTGLTHIGVAEKIPTLLLCGSTLPYSDPALSKAQVLYHKLSCSPCKRQPICHGKFDCMQLLTPSIVASNALELFQ